MRSLVRGTRSVMPMPSLVLRAGDRLVLRDTAANLKEIEGSLKASLHGPTRRRTRRRRNGRRRNGEETAREKETKAASAVAVQRGR